MLKMGMDWKIEYITKPFPSVIHPRQMAEQKETPR
jgi:hypothetical protein